MRRLLTIFILCSIAALPTRAGVDLRTGNYFVTYTDIDFPGSKADITRSYSAKASHTGMFGYGWSTFMETRLYPLPDGTLILKWWGGGQGDYYEPSVVNKTGLYQMINAIIENLLKTDKINNNPVTIAEKKSYYLANNLERAQKYVALLHSKAVPAYRLPAEKKISWVQDENQVIRWDGKVFKVKSWDDDYRFNEIGLMTEVNDRNYSMQLYYEATNLKRILVDNKFWCNLETDSTGKITRMSTQDSGVTKVATFQYDNLNNLVYSKDIGENVYRFNYDLFHNLVRIDYDDNRFVQMDYDPANNRIIKFLDKNGTFQTYQYPYFYSEDGKVNFQHYATTVKRFDSLGTLLFTQYKEYDNRFRKDGSKYLHRLYERTDTSFHEALYDPAAENARYRNNKRGQAWAKYDAKKRPVYLRINDTIYQSSFNKMDLPASFTKIDSVRADTISYLYEYSMDGKLSKVIKNGRIFLITGSKAENILTIQSDEDELQVRFLKSKPYSIQNKRWGTTLVDDAAWRTLDSTLNPSNYLPSAAATDRTEAKAGDRQLLSEKSVELAAKKEAIARRKLTMESKSDDRREKLLRIFGMFSDVMAPISIRHEWIWERL